MDGKDEIREQRIKQWSALCEKYEKRGQLNSVDCRFSEVNYRHFAKPKLKKCKTRNRKRWNTTQYINAVDYRFSKVNYRHFLKSKLKKCKTRKGKRQNSNHCIKASDLTDNLKDTDCKQIINLEGTDISVIVDGDADVNTIENISKSKIIEDSNVINENVDEDANEFTQPYLSTESKQKDIGKNNGGDMRIQNSLDDLIKLIEIVLQSNLKELLTNRGETKILESDDYSYWHERTKEEMRRLQKYITKRELKEYMIHCNSDSAGEINAFSDIIHNQMRSSIKELLIKREFARNDKQKYQKYCLKIYNEWQKLLKGLHVNGMILYASYVINAVKRGKFKISETEQTGSSQYTFDSLSNFIDSGNCTS